jgi:methylglutaconyl-CoA hydratase
MFETITLDVDARGVAVLTLNRPEKHNAMSGQMIDELARAAARLDADGAVRVVVLTGQGRSFCAGGDLGWMKAQMAADSATRAAEARKLADMLGALNSMSKPLIARVQGNAFGGGVGLCCVCDKVFATDTATFGLTETKLGLIPATIGPYVVARMGGGNARQVFMSSRPFDAIEAQRLGIVSSLTTSQDLEAAVETEIKAYLKCAPAAVAEAKTMALALGGAPTKATIDASIKALVKRWEHPEARQGITAFFDKSVPPWG